LEICFKKLVETAKIMHPDNVKVFHIINLRRNTVAEGIDDIADNVSIQVWNISEHFEALSIPVVENTMSIVSHDFHRSSQIAIRRSFLLNSLWN
jgi:hypothetical protein